MRTLVSAFTGGGNEPPAFEKFDVNLECAVCGSMTFDSGFSDCWHCDWPLAIDTPADAFGHEALVKFPAHLGGNREMKRVGPLSRLRSAAKSAGGKILAVRWYSPERWLRAFGNPEERGL